MIMEAGKSQDFQDKTKAGHPGELTTQFQFKDRQAQEQETADVSVQLWKQKKADGLVQKKSGRKCFIQEHVSFFYSIQTFTWLGKTHSL